MEVSAPTKTAPQGSASETQTDSTTSGERSSLPGQGYAAQTRHLRPKAPGSAAATRAPEPAPDVDVPESGPPPSHEEDPAEARTTEAEADHSEDEGSATTDEAVEIDPPGASAGTSPVEIALPYRAEAESTLGVNLSDVRAFFDPAVAEDGADALATESGEVRFAEATPDREDVFHELAHVAQRKRNGAAASQELSAPEDEAEHEAVAASKKMAKGKKPKITKKPSAKKMRKASKSKRPFALTNKNNRGRVTNNTGKKGKRRPGIAVKGHFNFKIIAPGAAQVFYGDLKTELGTVKHGRHVRANPTTARKGPDGQRYILIWYGKKGAGWTAVGNVQYGRAIARKSSLYKAWEPARPRGRGKRRVFREPAQYHDPGNEKKAPYVFQRQDEGANRVEHHGLREAWGVPLYNIFLNLPQSDAAAVARDVAKPGDSFTVISKQRVPTYAKNGTVPKASVVFYFGYVNGNKSRRGWVMGTSLK